MGDSTHGKEIQSERMKRMSTMYADNRHTTVGKLRGKSGRGSMLTGGSIKEEGGTVRFPPIRPPKQSKTQSQYIPTAAEYNELLYAALSPRYQQARALLEQRAPSPPEIESRNIRTDIPMEIDSFGAEDWLAALDEPPENEEGVDGEEMVSDWVPSPPNSEVKRRPPRISIMGGGVGGSPLGGPRSPMRSTARKDSSIEIEGRIIPKASPNPTSNPTSNPNRKKRV